ncbi:hypothetical protein K7H91_22210 [Martelella mediterranea]|uniref:NAD(P)-dependent oxidoreductase n=1 Tax=Martelella mediterranea TaxID=293089 RepID=UPI001E3EEB5C|nr:NAD(P)-dependent oxidoreductase [Martelella mediterranea]MCD1636476.1 hypothetical protein [Martelella mediterranea]
MTEPADRPVPVITICDADPMLRLAAIALRGARGDDDRWLTRYFSPEPVDVSAVEGIGPRHGLAGVEVRALSTAEEPRLAELSAGSDILICRRAAIGTAELAASPALRRVVRLGSDATGLDLAAIRTAGADVICMERPSLAYTAEHAVLLMLAAAKNLVQSDALARDARWDRNRVFPIDGVAYNWPGLSGLGGLFNAKIGMIGMGQVGLLVAERLRPFGARLLYAKRHRLPAAQEAQYGLEFTTRDDLLARSDIVSLHARWTPETEGMMNAAAFARMKRGAIFINTSRGFLVDEAALADALTSGQLGFAALDTHAPEPRAATSPLNQAPNTIFTPHVAGGSRGVLVKEIDDLVKQVGAVFSDAEADDEEDRN